MWIPKPFMALHSTSQAANCTTGPLSARHHARLDFNHLDGMYAFCLWDARTWTTASCLHVTRWASSPLVQHPRRWKPAYLQVKQRRSAPMKATSLPSMKPALNCSAGLGVPTWTEPPLLKGVHHVRAWHRRSVGIAPWKTTMLVKAM